MEFRKVDINEAKDTGLAIVLILLIVQHIRHPGWLVSGAIAVLVVTMAYPAALKPFGRLWFSFSHILGTVVSRIILTLVFFLVVTPVGIIRRILGSDPMKNKLWKRDNNSVLVKRDHHYSPEDLQNPY